MVTRITSSGLNDVRQKLQRMKYNIDHLEEPLEDAGTYYRAQLKAQFKKRGAHLGSRPWKPLAQNTVREKKKYRTSPLLRTGKLRTSYTVKNAPGNISKVYRRSAVFGSDLTRKQIRGKRKTIPLAAFHQYGTTRMPKRPVMRANRTLAGYTGQKIAEHIVDPFEVG